ncbi:pyridoxamine 5'-phosphate oxidase [Pelagivirga sediminicola]|uniref:Pyridoxamine 5'-phosphate oxidase n=1 Tax=Pelagivirga sediminicola TaxID=2170575 RepID=A0A2T7G4L7_9RHOB|nr:MSMEG_1061 family FMN-dependent PPOX-type flavoprotein [Pelagivirga sediminicola]PVA09355.1 pyridoxamine 5'-phosphate oxidase [Pelagivirga sediminicola]
MDYVKDIAALEALYGTPSLAAERKVSRQLLPLHAKWIAASRFCILSTVGPGGTDGSPRGDDGPVVTQLDPVTLAMPDWRGNNRMDSLRNIITDGRLSLMFMVPGSTTVIRINGRGRITTDAALVERFAKDGKLPRSVLVIDIAEVYLQCSRAQMRSGIWARDDSAQLPGMGDLLAEATEGAIDGARFDADWAERSQREIWS